MPASMSAGTAREYNPRVISIKCEITYNNSLKSSISGTLEYLKYSEGNTHTSKKISCTKHNCHKQSTVDE